MHQIRATTVIFEEDCFCSPEPIEAKFIYPIKPHATALQVEEIGSFTFSTYQDSTEYDQMNAGVKLIIEENESDNDASCTIKRTRNVSINSVPEDELTVYQYDEVRRDMYELQEEDDVKRMRLHIIDETPWKIEENVDEKFFKTSRNEERLEILREESVDEDVFIKKEKIKPEDEYDSLTLMRQVSEKASTVSEDSKINYS